MMNPGVGEEAGSTARTLIGSLSSTPVILALVVFNVMYVGFGFWTQVQQGNRFTENQKIWADMVDKVMQHCPAGGHQ